MLVAGRTCPYQSWQNIVERAMSTLNLALVNVLLALPQNLEPLLCNKTTLPEVRKVIAEHADVGEALCDAMQGVLSTLSKRIGSMEIKAEPI